VIRRAGATELTARVVAADNEDGSVGQVADAIHAAVRAMQRHAGWSGSWNRPSAGDVDRHRLAAVTVLQVAAFDRDLVDVVGDLERPARTGERLFVRVVMSEVMLSEHPAVPA
jgi:hypothetical protein